MKSLSFTVHVEPGEDGYYIASVPALPGCVTQGETYHEAIAMAQDAIRCYLEGLVKDGEPIPQEPPPTGPVDVWLEIDSPAAA